MKNLKLNLKLWDLLTQEEILNNISKKYLVQKISNNICEFQCNNDSNLKYIFLYHEISFVNHVGIPPKNNIEISTLNLQNKILTKYKSNAILINNNYILYEIKDIDNKDYMKLQLHRDLKILNKLKKEFAMYIFLPLFFILFLIIMIILNTYFLEKVIISILILISALYSILGFKHIFILKNNINKIKINLNLK